MLKKILSTLLAGFLLAGVSYAQGVLGQVTKAINDLKAVGGGTQYNNLTPAQKKQAIAMMLATNSNGETDSTKAAAIQSALESVPVDASGDIRPSLAAEYIQDDLEANQAVSSRTPIPLPPPVRAVRVPPPPAPRGPEAGPPRPIQIPENGGPLSGTGEPPGPPPIPIAFGSSGTLGGGGFDFTGTLGQDQVNQTVRAAPSIAEVILEEVGGSASLN